MFEINDNVVFVQGAKNGAIYDFNPKKVYSVNDIGCNLINQYIQGDKSINENEYLQLLANNNLLNDNYRPIEFSKTDIFQNELELVWLEITPKCNLRCIHCYEGEIHEAVSDPLSLEQWKDVIDQIAALKVKRVVVIGGEPCCNDNLCSILNYICQYKIDTTVFSNGTLMDEEILQTIIQTNTRVKVSVYGHKAYVHDSITGVKGSFEKLFNQVGYLISHNIEVTAAVVVMKENQEYVNDIVKFVKEQGMNYSRYDVIRNIYGGKQNCHTPDKKEVLEYAYYLKPNFSTTREKFIKAMFLNSCWYGKMVIMDNGDVLPCEFEREYKYGNVKNTNISEILMSDALQKKWRLTYSYIDDCKDCEYRFACHDCRALGKSVSGNIYGKNPRCLYDVTRGIWRKLDTDDAGHAMCP